MIDLLIMLKIILQQFTFQYIFQEQRICIKSRKDGSNDMCQNHGYH